VEIFELAACGSDCVLELSHTPRNSIRFIASRGDGDQSPP
jgi:hypothetical protein